MIRISVSRADATVLETETLTAGRIGLVCEFVFSSDWDDLEKVAVFDGEVTKEVMLDENNRAIVPAECMATAGYKLRCGVTGLNAEQVVVLPTVYVNAGKIRESAEIADSSIEEITPSLASQVISRANEALRVANELASDAESGAFDGVTLAGNTGVTLGMDEEDDLLYVYIGGVRQGTGIDLGTGYAGAVVLSAQSITVPEGESATFTVALDSPPQKNQKVYIVSSNPNLLSVNPAILTFTPANYATAQQVTVAALQNEDMGDNTVTVTVTLRAASTQIPVTIKDDDTPELITNGLDLYFNLRNGSSGLTDSIHGVVATQTNGEFVDGGLKLPGSNANMAWKYPVTTNIPNGFTIEYAISSKDKTSARLFDFAASGSGYGGGYAAQFYWSNAYVYAGFAYNVNGTLTKGKIPYTADLFTAIDWDSEHTVATVWHTDGSADLYIDGTRIGGREAVDGFENYVVSGTMSFKLPYFTGNGNPNLIVAEMRFYNRALTGAEVLNNYRSDVSRQSTANFT